MSPTNASKSGKSQSIQLGFLFIALMSALSLMSSHNTLCWNVGDIVSISMAVVDGRGDGATYPEIGYAEANNSEVSTTAPLKKHREIEFVLPSEIYEIGEYYSGMWWQNKDYFLSTNYDNDIVALEQASFRLFYSRTEKVRLVRDWLDFSVEHLSKYIKHMITMKEAVIQETLIDIVQEYIRRTSYFNVQHPPNSVVSSTIALVPFRSSRGQQPILVTEMAATLASLWQIGIPRALVVGLSQEEEDASQEAFALLQDKIAIHPMELAYVTYFNASDDDRKLVPRLALTGLQKVMRQSLENSTDGTNEEVEAWLGSDPLRWKYVYFTEPDLLLHTRPDALDGLSKALQDGLIMAAHRLEPIPHYRNYPLDRNSTIRSAMDSKVIPDSGVFAAIHEVDPMLGHSCCDQGKFYPSNRENPQEVERVIMKGRCPDVWTLCGFSREDKDYGNLTVILEEHNRLLGYPLFTIKGGTGFPLAGSSQRVCVPRPYPFECTPTRMQQKV